MILRTKCHPEANGRKPRPPDQAYVVRLPLENGEILTIEMGQHGFDTLSSLIMDMLTNAPEHDDGSLPKL
jgi:hypothetical protein